MEFFVVEIHDKGSYSDPRWCQFLHGLSTDSGEAIAVDGDKIYVGGYSYSGAFDEIALIGSPGPARGFYMVEIIDDDLTDDPTLNWGQWYVGSFWNRNDFFICAEGGRVYFGSWTDYTYDWGWTGITFEGDITIGGGGSGCESYIISTEPFVEYVPVAGDDTIFFGTNY